MSTQTLGPDLVTATTVDAVDAVVVGLTKADDGPTLVGAEFLGEAAAEVTAALVAVGATGAAEQLTRIPAPNGVGAPLLISVGLGVDPDAEAVRRSAGVAARACTGLQAVATTLSLHDLAAAAEGFYLGAYQFTAFKSALSAPKPDGVRVGSVALLVTDSAAAEPVLTRARAVARAVATAREFTNTPPSHLYPAEFADRARALGEAAGLTVDIKDEQALAEGGFGGIIGVGQGSSRPPRLVTLTYRGAPESGPSVALVGKGITFDTGGISIKPAAGMENMTSDMAGAAAVIATVILAAETALPVDVTAYVPMAENMPSHTAQRPGDVLTQYGGITVEVINTDAEGRLILADAIVLACEAEPDYLIDTATLTGAQMVALGNRTPGVMGTDTFRDRVARLSREVGEGGWPMPLPAELRKDLDSSVADLANVTNHRWGGMLAAALFLKEFVADGVQWAHIDVAGPAYNTGAPFGYVGKGGTGVPVRTMFAALEDIAAHG